MDQLLTQTTGTEPDCGFKTSPAPSITSSRASVPEGFRAWLPALVVLIGMPLLALATTKYVLLPSVKQAFTPSAALPGHFAAGQGTETPVIVQIPFNAADNAGVRSDIRGVALIGADSAFKDKVAQNKAKLAAVMVSDLNGITASDLNKPGVLDATRSQLLAGFNHALGGPVVKEAYITEWPPR